MGPLTYIHGQDGLGVKEVHHPDPASTSDQSCTEFGVTCRLSMLL